MSPNTKPCLDFDELVLAFLSELVGDKEYQPRLRSDRMDIHRFFWELCKEGITRGWVSDIMFDTNSSHPQSEELDELFQELQLCGLLGRENPSYRYYDIKFRDPLYRNNLQACVPKDERNKLQKAVASFKSRFGIPQTTDLSIISTKD